MVWENRAGPEGDMQQLTCVITAVRKSTYSSTEPEQIIMHALILQWFKWVCIVIRAQTVQL